MLKEAGFVKKKYSFKTYPVFFIRIFAAVLSFYSLLYAIVLTGIIFPLAVSYFCPYNYTHVEPKHRITFIIIDIQ